MPQLSPTEHRTIVVVDVADFTNPSRIVHDLMTVQEGLYEVLKAAFADSGVDFDSCTSEDRGDGALVLVPAEVPKSQLADLLPDRLVAAVRRYNANRVDTARFKLRVALHAGDIRHNDKGWVGHALNDAFRILEAEQAKIALTRSSGTVAVVVSDYFYNEVIKQDPGTAPETYRQIPVSVKKFAGTAWLRLPGEHLPPTLPPLPPAPPLPPPRQIEPSDLERVGDVHGVVPTEELSVLRVRLQRLDVPNLDTLVRRATGSAIPVPRRSSAWDTFNDLSDLNAGPDGVPPALAFLRILAREVGGTAGADIASWVEQQARRLRLIPALERHDADDDASDTAMPEDPHVHLMIMIEPDAIDPRRCVLSYWRQDDPLIWPPARGEVGEVGVDELEFRVDEVILAAEEAWAGQAISASVEFLLPRTLLYLPVHRWRKEHDSGDPRPLYLDYEITRRSLERMQRKHWHRQWKLRWDLMLRSLSADRVHPFGPSRYQDSPLDVVLSDPHWVGLVMVEPPTPQPDPGSGPDGLTAALRAGIPLVLWHPAAGPEELRDLIMELLPGSGQVDLPAQLKNEILKNDNSLVRDLVILWDDPKRVIVLDQPTIASQR